MRKITKVIDMGRIAQQVFAATASIFRVAQAGLDLAPKGALTAPIPCGKSRPCMIYNSGGATAYIKFGATSADAVPTNAATGIPVLAGEKAILNSGEGEWIICDATTKAAVYAYLDNNG